MSEFITIKIDNKKFKKALRKIDKYASDAKNKDIPAVIKKSTLIINALAVKIAVQKKIWDTGNLIRRITFKILNNGLTGRVISEAEYSSTQEFGTKSIEPRPYMKPALKQQTKILLKDIKRALQKK